MKANTSFIGTEWDAVAEKTSNLPISFLAFRENEVRADGKVPGVPENDQIIRNTAVKHEDGT